MSAENKCGCNALGAFIGGLVVAVVLAMLGAAVWSSAHDVARTNGDAELIYRGKLYRSVALEGCAETRP